MRIRQNTLAIIVIVILFGGIFGSRALGLWITESTKVPRLISEGEFAGSYDPADIRGSYSFGDIEKSFSIPAATLKAVFTGDEYPVEASAILAKDLEELYAGAAIDAEVGTDSLRVFVSYYLRIPYSSTESTILPTAAVELLNSRSMLTPEEYERLLSTSVPFPSTTGSIAAPTDDTTSDTHVESADTEIKGKTTFADLLSWGLKEQAILEVLQLDELPGRAVTVRQYCLDNGIEFETIKTALQELVNAL